MFWKRAKEVHSSGQHFNQAADAWKNAGLVFRRGRTTELDQLIAEVVRHCQLSIEADNKNGDAYVLLADALLLAAVSGESNPDDERYKYLTSRAAAVICYWNDLPFKSYPVTKGKHATRGGELYGLLHNIVAAEAASSTVNDADQIMKELSSQLITHTASPSGFREIAQVIFAESCPTAFPGNEASDKSALPEARKNQGLAHPTQTNSDRHAAVREETPKILQCGMNTAQWHNCLGEAYNAQCRFDDAIAEFKKALTINPNDAEVHYQLGLAYENRGNLDDAIEQYKNALKIDPNYAEALNDMEKAYDYQRKADETIMQYKEALSANPNDAEAHLRLGFVYYEDLGKLNEAIAEFKEVLRVNPNSAEAHLRLGNVCSDQGRIDEAIIEYREALRISPNDYVVHYNLGASYATQGKLDEAIEEFKEALRINPKYTTARYRLGKEYQAQGRLDQAITEYRETLSIIPGFAYAHNSLGLVYRAQDKLDEAVREFKEALLIDPSLAQAYSNLGLAYMAQGKFYEGAAQFRKALTIDPNDAGAIYGLGTIFEKRGRLQHALRCYEATTKLAWALPDYVDTVRDAENRISKLKKLA